MSIEKENKLSPHSGITLEIEGMTCAHCAQTIEKALKSKGVENVIVDFANAEATVKTDGKINVEELIDAVHKAGYLAKKKTSYGPHEHEHGTSGIEKKFFLSLVFTLPLFAHMFFPHDFFLNNPFVQIALCIPVMITGWLHFGKSAVGSLRAGSPNMDVLITLGSSAAFFYSMAGILFFYNQPEMHNYLFFETAATIISLVLLGNLMEHRSIKKTTSAIKELNALQATTAKKIIIENNNELIKKIHTDEIRKGDVFLVNTGDKIPIDGEIISGNGSIDESMITGESMPVSKSQKEKVIGGTILSDGNLRMKATATGEETVLSKIIEMVKAAQQDKPKIQRLGDQVSAVFVPAVIFISLVTFSLAFFAFDLPGQKSLMNAIAVLVIACPCAMGLATPTAIMVGLGRAAKNGILIKGAGTVEEFSKIKTVVFDKTGTITTGNFKIKNILPFNGSNVQELTDIIFQLEKHSSHPIAKSLVRELENKALEKKFSDIKEMKGIGISAKDGQENTIEIGSERLVGENTNVQVSYSEHGPLPLRATRIFILRNKILIGIVEIEDELKKNVIQTIAGLNSLGINTILVSGDKKENCEELARKAGIRKVFSEQLPEQKMKIISGLVKKNPTAMVGDGINDAPSLALATVGISLSNATQIAINSAQIILLESNDLSSILRALRISKLTLSTIKQNLFWAFFYNVLAIPFAAFGFLSPMIAALSMAFSDVIVIGNSLRLKVKKL